ncbi:hypothetical protein [Nonlabens sp.]|uniref:hypothetical protein n=1 Tax=Nonlabens sp. TaxID=1888209 RepID=UPI003F4AAF1C
MCDKHVYQIQGSMGTHKNIGKAVKEKLSAYTDSPDDALWASIEQSLGPEKKKRRVLIWWWLAGGILLGIMGSVGYISFIEINEENHFIPINEIVNDQNDITNPLNNKKSSTPVHVDENTESSVISNSNLVDHEKVMNPNDVEKVSKKTRAQYLTSNNKTISNVFNSKESIEKESIDTLKAGNELNDTVVKQIESREVAFINKTTESSTSISEKTILKNRRDSIKSVNEKKRELRIEERKLLADLKKDLPQDSTELKDTKQKKSESSWSVTAMGIVTHYQNVNNGNSLDKDFDDLLIEDRVSLNYGGSLNFITNDYLQLRIGINHMRFNQTTKSVPADFNIINNLQYVSYEVEETDIAAFLGSDSASTIEIDHDLNYVEIPLEVRLRLNDGDLEVSTIFGMSYMILIDQYFTARNSNSQLRFGRATFINDANFNVNAGFGLRYNLYKRFYLNTDFMFKYQIKTYSQTRDIDPAYFNIQMGIEYKL